MAALNLRPGMRAGLVQLLAAFVALVLGLVLPKIGREPRVSAHATQPFLFALAGGLITFIALVFSLLFLMIQYATTIFTPRLTIFRDDPRVWRAFAVFIGAFVYCATAGLRVGDEAHTTAIVPALGMFLVLVSLVLARNLQVRALRLLQMNTTLEELRSRGARTLTQLYTRPTVSDRPRDSLPEIAQSVRWTDAGSILIRVNVAELCAVAHAANTVVRLHVGVGEEITRGSVVITVHGATRSIANEDLLKHLHVGTDRQFDQDPLLAFRLLSDIAIRALSQAVNDPASAVSAIAAIDDLLRIVAERDLDIGRVTDPSGALRVVLDMPTWDDFLGAGVDDVAPYAADSPMCAARLRRLLDELADRVLPERRDLVERRRRRLAKSPMTHGSIAEYAADQAGQLPFVGE